MRPNLKLGDVVRLSKHGKKILGYLRKETFVVISRPHSLQQDGFDQIHLCYQRTNIIRKTECFVMQRKDLWRTGYNIYDAGKTFNIHKTSSLSKKLKPFLGTPRTTGITLAPQKNIQPAFGSITKQQIDDFIKSFRAGTLSSAPTTKEVKCGCGRASDLGQKCWWCGKQN